MQTGGKLKDVKISLEKRREVNPSILLVFLSILIAPQGPPQDFLSIKAEATGCRQEIRSRYELESIRI